MKTQEELEMLFDISCKSVKECVKEANFLSIRTSGLLFIGYFIILLFEVNKITTLLLFDFIVSIISGIFIWIIVFCFEYVDFIKYKLKHKRYE